MSELAVQFGPALLVAMLAAPPKFTVAGQWLLLHLLIQPEGR